MVKKKRFKVGDVIELTDTCGWVDHRLNTLAIIFNICKKKDICRRISPDGKHDDYILQYEIRWLDNGDESMTDGRFMKLSSSFSKLLRVI